MDPLVCFMMVLQDYESESPTRDSGRTFSSADFLATEFGNSVFNTTQSSSLTRIIGELGEGLIQGAGRMSKRNVEAKSSSEL